MRFAVFRILQRKANGTGSLGESKLFVRRLPLNEALINPPNTGGLQSIHLKFKGLNHWLWQFLQTTNREYWHGRHFDLWSSPFRHLFEPSLRSRCFAPICPRSFPELNIIWQGEVREAYSETIRNGPFGSDEPWPLVYPHFDPRSLTPF